MKHLTITFGLAVGLICMVILYNKSQSNELEAGTTTIAKTIVETDANGNVTSELTMVIAGNRWVEKTKKMMSYGQGCKTEVNYEFNDGKWVEVSKVVKLYNAEEVLNNEVMYAMANQIWVEIEKRSYDDLSTDSDVMEDLVFDKDGNLIMCATYMWNGSVKDKGVNKTEYVYDGGGAPCRQISYDWKNDSWHKSQVSDLLYVSMDR
jgi:hypothetical protein